MEELDESRFTCTSDTEVLWTFNGKQLPNTAEVIHNKNKNESDLSVYPTFMDNRGSYWCEGEITDEDYGFYDIGYLTVQRM